MDGNKSLSKALKMDNYVEEIGEEFRKISRDRKRDVLK